MGVITSPSVRRWLQVSAIKPRRHRSWNSPVLERRRESDCIEPLLLLASTSVSSSSSKLFSSPLLEVWPVRFLGVAVTAVFTLVNGWILSTPSLVVAAVIIDGVSGLCPLVRAACTPPTAALNA